MTVAGGEAALCGRAVELVAPASGRRVVEIADLRLPGNLDVDVAAGPRHAMGMRGCFIDAAGKRSGVGVELVSAGETDLAPSLVVESTQALATQGATVQLSGGSNLNLLAPGDLIVLATDADDVDDLWTILKANRAGIVHEVVTQTTTAAEIVLAGATDRPILQTADAIRVVGRSGTATVDSVGTTGPVATFAWLRADDHSRVLASQNPMAADQIVMGNNADLRHFPGLDEEPVTVSGVALRQGAVNGALTRLVTLEIAQDSAVSFTPDSIIGMVHVFGHASLGDPSAASFTYRADGLGYTQLVAGVGTRRGPARHRAHRHQRKHRQVHLLRAYRRQDLRREPPGRPAAHGEPVRRRCPALARPRRRPRREPLRGQVGFRQFVWLWNRCQGQTTPPLHVEIAEWLGQRWQAGDRRLVLMVFRSAGKSTLVGIFCAWLLLNHPDLRILVLAAEQDLARKMVRNVKRIIERHPLTRNLVPKRADQWAADQFTVRRRLTRRDPSILARGIGANITGSRADIVICDDVEVPNTCATALRREELRSRLHEISYVLVPEGLQLYVGTPHSYDSIYAEPSDDDQEAYLGGFERLCIPLLDEEGESRWPERFTPEGIAEIRRRSGPAKFDSQMLLQPKNVEDIRLDPAHLVRYDAPLELRHANGESILSISGRRMVSAPAAGGTRPMALPTPATPRSWPRCSSTRPAATGCTTSAI